MEFIVECPLDAKIYNHELTLKLKKRSANMTITQDGKVIKYTTSADGEWVFVNVLPGVKVEVAFP